MSLWGSIIGAAGDVIGAAITGGGGGGGTTVTNTANSSSDVEVNPEITTINAVDLAPFAEVVAQLAASARTAENQATERAAETVDRVNSTLLLVIAGGALFWVARK
jgi:hypothetical protein